MPSYWQSDTAPIARGFGNIAQALIQTPRLRAQGALMRAQGDEAQARTGLLTTQAQRGKMQLSEAMLLAQKLQESGAVTQDADGNTIISKEAAPVILSHLAGMGTSANDSSSAIGGLLKANNAPVQANLTRALTGKMAQDKLDAADAKGFQLSPGAARYDATGKLLVERPSAASTAETYDTVTEKYPAVQAQDEAPATHTGGFLGFGGKDVPATPATDYQPERTIARKVPRGSNLTDALSQTNAPAALPVTVAGGVPTVNSQEDYDALPPGSQYKDSSGNIAVKKKKSTVQ